MGIDVSHDRFVTMNDTHQNGVDTSTEANPSRQRLRGLELTHVFRRNHRGSRRDDGNPLIYALKGRNGFRVMPFWESRFIDRAREILAGDPTVFEEVDYCMPIPSSSPFCAKFAAVVAEVAELPIIDPIFLRKKTIGELVAELQAEPPHVRKGLRGNFTSQMNAWENVPADTPYEAKSIDATLRPLFRGFCLADEPPVLTGKKILIVDDLFSTGSSLLSVRSILGDQLGASLSGLFFLSGTL